MDKYLIIAEIERLKEINKAKYKGEDWDVFMTVDGDEFVFYTIVNVRLERALYYEELRCKI